MDPYEQEPRPPQTEGAEHGDLPEQASPPEDTAGAGTGEPREEPTAAWHEGAGPEPEHRRIEIDVIEGDAHIYGGAPQVLLTAPGVHAQDRIAEDVGGVLRLRRLPDDSELHVPDGAHVLIHQIYGDLLVERLDGYLDIQHAGSDLALTGVALTEISQLDGDLVAAGGGGLHIRSISGDARISDYNEAPLLGTIGGDLQGDHLPGLELSGAVGGDVALELCGSVTLIGTIGGDLHARRTLVELRGSAVGGDVTLVATAGVTLAAVGGDLEIEEASGAVEVHSVGGDVSLRRTHGRVRLGTVGGDLQVKDALGGIVAGRVGSDADLDTTLSAGAEYTIHAGGDISLHVRGDVNARFVAQTFGGEIRTRLPLSVERGRRRNLVGVLGRGDATVTLQSSGDISITAADRFEEEQRMSDMGNTGDEFAGAGTADREDEQGGPRTWETAFGRHRFRFQWGRQPGRANFSFKGPFTGDDDPDAMGAGPSRDFNVEWERGKSPRFTGEYQHQLNELRDKVEKAARKAAEQAQQYAERAAKRARDTDWEAVGREVRSAVERAMGDLERAFGQARSEWERNRPGSTDAGSSRPSGAQRVRIEMDDSGDPLAGQHASGSESAASSDEADARRRTILEQLRNGAISLDEAERQLNELR